MIRNVSVALLGISFAIIPLTALGQGITPKIEELSGLEADMIYPPIPAPLDWRGGGCFSEPGEEVCAKGYELLTGSEGAYTALVTGVSAGQTDDGKALWHLIDLMFLNFPTTENTFWLSGECQAGPEGTTPIVFFEPSPEGAAEALPKPIWGAHINLVTAMIEREEKLESFECSFEAG